MTTPRAFAPTSSTPNKFFDDVSMTLESLYRFRKIIWAPHLQRSISALRHAEHTPTKREVTGSPYRKGGLNSDLGSSNISHVPDFDGLIERARYNLVFFVVSPVNTIDFGTMRIDLRSG